jgi:hypothetical protein
MRTIPALTLAALCACARVGEQVRDACPESRNLLCQAGNVTCSQDAARGCQVCACRGVATPDASGTLHGPVPPEQIPARPPNLSP